MNLKKVFSFLLVAAMTFSATLAFAAENEMLQIEKVSGYDTLTPNPDGGVMEIIAYNKLNHCAYAVNGQNGMIAIIPIAEDSELTAEEFDVRAQVTTEGFVYGDMTSVAVSPNGEMLAVAIQAEGYNDNGKVAIFNCNTDGTIDFIKTIDTGVQPDMAIFFDDNTVLTADEGEPREGYGENVADPKGSVSIIDIKNSVSTVVDFSDFDARREELVENGIVIKKETMPSVDLEPEYIAVADGKAYVTLQEANAVAVMDIEAKDFTGIYSLGFEDYSVTAVDIDKKDEAYEPNTYDSLMGIRMADGISAFEVNGVTYLVTANEGDSREWGEYLNEDERNFGKGHTSPTGEITAENSGLDGKVVFFSTGDYDGLDETKDYLFGGRSFTVYEVRDDGIYEIYTSKDDFERITAEKLPEYFNCSNDDKTIDDRSGKKGPEPESVTVGAVDGRLYAFVALERVGGIMAYDVTDPANIFYANYVNSRDFSDDIAGDVAPEGLAYVEADKNSYGKNLLLTACEVSGTVAVYAVGGSSGLPFEIKDGDIVIKTSGQGIDVFGQFTRKTNYAEADVPRDGENVVVTVSYLKNGAAYMVTAVETIIEDGKINIPASKISTTDEGVYEIAGVSVLSGVTAIDAITTGNLGTPVATYKP